MKQDNKQWMVAGYFLVETFGTGRNTIYHADNETKMKRQDIRRIYRSDLSLLNFGLISDYKVS